jgi:hypothetical protein
MLESEKCRRSWLNNSCGRAVGGFDQSCLIAFLWWGEGALSFWGLDADVDVGGEVAGFDVATDEEEV